MDKFLIIGSGDFCCPSDFKERCVIACDGGLDHCAAHGIDPYRIIGDMDSVSPESLGHFKDRQMTVFPVKKDKTDIELGIELAFELGAKDIVLTGVLSGTRLDHTLCNIQLLKKCADRGIAARAINATNDIFLLKGGMSADIADTGRYISVMPLCERAEGLTMTGFEYPLCGHTLELGTSLCVSNKISGKKGTVSLDKGVIAIISAED
ncbi:MAG: thiamine diphosphokinase [Firmicutes bacterium]|nr:thiamine diphosphokinase [Bacillota bacterium]